MLGAGQQVVVSGIHPDTRRPYTWHGGYEPGAIARSDLPEIDEKETEALLAYIADMLAEKFGFQKAQAAGNGRDTDTDERTSVDPDAELASMRDGASTNAAHCRIIPSLLWKMHPDEVLDTVVDATMAMAAHHGLGWTREVEIRAVRKRILSTYNNLFLRDYDPATGVIPTWLPGEFHEIWAEKLKEGNWPVFGFNRGGFYVRARQGSATDTTGAPEETETQGASADKQAEKQPKPRVWPTPYSGRAAAQIPLRNFILGQHYLIGASSVTASAGGVGKSTLSLLDAVSFAVGRNLLTGEILEKRRRVWVWNAEDDVDEMERRVVGICAHYGINRADLDGWLFLDSGYDLPLELAHGNGKGPVVKEDLIDLIAARVKEREIEVVVLDPLVALHTMAEGRQSRPRQADPHAQHPARQALRLRGGHQRPHAKAGHRAGHHDRRRHPRRRRHRLLGPVRPNAAPDEPGRSAEIQRRSRRPAVLLPTGARQGEHGKARHDLLGAHDRSAHRQPPRRKLRRHRRRPHSLDTAGRHGRASPTRSPTPSPGKSPKANTDETHAPGRRGPAGWSGCAAASTPRQRRGRTAPR